MSCQRMRWERVLYRTRAEADRVKGDAHLGQHFHYGGELRRNDCSISSSMPLSFCSITVHGDLALESPEVQSDDDDSDSGCYHQGWHGD